MKTENIVEVEAVDLKPLVEIVSKHLGVKGSLISLLQEVQNAYGYLPKMALAELARLTQISEAKIYGVATFYTQFRHKPIGKYLIMLCQGTACYVNGSATIERAISETLGIGEGETTPDQLFTFNNVACLGCCSLAPVMMINEETHANLTPDKTRQILNAIIEKERLDG